MMASDVVVVVVVVVIFVVVVVVFVFEAAVNVSAALRNCLWCQSVKGFGKVNIYLCVHCCTLGASCSMGTGSLVAVVFH